LVRFSYRHEVPVVARDEARDIVLRSVIRAVQLVQEASGRGFDGLSDRTDLLRDVDGFDSLNALEVIAQVSEDLRMEISERLIATAKDQTTLTIGELVDRILTHAKETAHVKQATRAERNR
jgi:acyl carrier protein